MFQDKNNKLTINSSSFVYEKVRESIEQLESTSNSNLFWGIFGFIGGITATFHAFYSYKTGNFTNLLRSIPLATTLDLLAIYMPIKNVKDFSKFRDKETSSELGKTYQNFLKLQSNIIELDEYINICQQTFKQNTNSDSTSI